MGGITEVPDREGCSDDASLLGLASGLIVGETKARMEAHVSRCEPCRDELERWRHEWQSQFDDEGRPDAGLEAFQKRVGERLDGLTPGLVRPAWRTHSRGVLAGVEAWIGWTKQHLVPAMAAALVFLGAVSLYQWGRLAERDALPQARLIELEGRALLRAAMLQNSRVLQDWSAVSGNPPDSLAIAASLRDLEVVEFPRATGGAYFMPTVLRVDGEGAQLGASLDRDPMLRAEVDEYTRRFSDVLLPLSDALVEAGRVGQARTLFDHLRRQHPEIVGNWYGEAEMRKLEGDHSGAIALYEEMKRRNVAPGDPRPDHYAGYSYSVLGDVERALESYNRALVLAPDYAKVYYNRAQLYRQMASLASEERQRLYQEDMSRALEAAASALEVEGDANPRITFTLAILHAVREEAGSRDLALEFLEKAMQWERSYVMRAQAEPAFAFFRDARNEPYHSRFDQLIERYRVRSTRFGPRQESYDPKVFIE
jgi:tetratricopeptide (TPR) repeat protein